MSTSDDILHITPGFDYYAINLSNGVDLDHLHIKKVEVFTGPDDGQETELITVTSTECSTEPELNVRVKKNHQRKASGRLRGEPCVRLYIESEKECCNEEL